MRLKSLKLAGFKSFANPTTFTFKHDITAIVGPNGCGKSNVIDAIRWVLGETSAKQLRGASMSDVIFAGVEGRAAKSLASVELTFEHTQDETTGIRHALNLYQELTLRRQVTREGKSDYYINGQRVRRRDVVDVFLGTGLGARSYAVIEQGMIGRIVESSPMQLREFIEEGAGVSRYQARRDETEKKLAETQDNLERLSDLQGELKKQQRTLERQAESAKKYQALSEELAKINQEDLLKRIFEAWQYHEQNQQQEQEVNAHLTTLQASVNRAKAELDKLSAKVAEGQWLKDDAKDKYHNAQMAEQTAQHNFYTMSQELSQVDEKQARLIATQKDAQESMTHAKADIDKIDAELISITPLLADESDKLKSVQESQNQAQDAWQKARQDLTALQEQKNSLQNAKKLAETQKSRTLSLREKWIKKHNDLSLSATEFSDDTKDNDRLIRLTEQIDIAEDKLINLQDNQTIKTDVETTEVNLKNTQTQVTTLQKRHAILMAEYEFLHKIVHKKPEQALQSADKPSPLMGLSTLKEHIRLSQMGENYAAVLDGFLGFWLDACISDTMPDAVFWHIPAKDMPKAILTIGTKAHSEQHTQLLPINRLIDTPKLALFERCYLCIDELDEANDLTKRYADLLSTGAVILTMNGWIVGAFGTLHITKFGSQHDNFLAQKAEYTKRLAVLEDDLNTLEEELEGQQTKMKALSAQLENQKILLDEHTAQKTAATAALHKLREEQTVLQSQIKLEQLKKDNFTKNKAILDEEKAEIVQELKALEQEITDITQKLAEHLPKLTQSEKDLAHLTAKLDELNRVIKHHHDSSQDLQLKHSALTQSLTHNKRLLEMADKNAKQAALDLAKLTESQQRLDDKLPQAELIFKEAKAQTMRLKIISEEHEAAAKALQLMHTKLQEDLTQSHAELAKEQAKAAQVGADTAVALSRLQDFGEQMRKCDETFNLSSTLADFRQKTPKFKDNSARISAINDEIAKIGAVNLAAAAELDELNARVSPMDAQISDITESMIKLQDAIRAIDEKTKTLFLAALDAVNTELNALFSKVFGGGTASLTLMEDDSLPKSDKWRAGLVLMAQPKGKRNSRLAVLSGGEKTLTALSLIFAIFKQHPAPFCLLDEVDAPLDDANVGRFTSLIHELADSVQFIFISHNKLAMQIADELKGITMPTAGVSSLVTVDLAQAEKYLEQ
ncbi:chromosome segregation protein SMC [Moraxella nasovis]|uniref:chromosome segregation protein SMC n=1 Tax=Moraxella nasovis TaxID=2904121 RepID=UPI001F60D878|nr:chromosome segregation protein SMC [Moraxella nasovis]UNU73822.1 chromosome segregation protein SMC [Moraxella nasovis]